jgi:hypothetical protein
MDHTSKEDSLYNFENQANDNFDAKSVILEDMNQKVLIEANLCSEVAKVISNVLSLFIVYNIVRNNSFQQNAELKNRIAIIFI